MPPVATRPSFERLHQALSNLEKTVVELQVQIQGLRSELHQLEATSGDPTHSKSSFVHPNDSIPVSDFISVTIPPSQNTPKPAHAIVPEAELTPKEKIALFASLFTGRTEVYATRWTSKTGKSGYFPHCANRFAPNCTKKCHLCTQRNYVPVTEQTYFSHLKGEIVMGVYPLLSDNTCHFALLDFDDQNWRRDGKAVIKTARQLQIPLVPEISRSGNGVHLWLFFNEPTLASTARRILERLLSMTMVNTGLIKLDSFDRIIPCQDKLPEGSIGNLVALPMQPASKIHGGSVFVDDELNIIERPWHHLQNLKRLTPDEAHSFLKLTEQASSNSSSTKATDSALVLEPLPWERAISNHKPLAIAPNIKALTIRLDNALFFRAEELTAPLSSALVRLATISNPNWYKAQFSHLPVWKNGSYNKLHHRFITYARSLTQWLVLPRGTLDNVKKLLDDNNLQYLIEDERSDGKQLRTNFLGTLTAEQSKLLKRVLKKEQGIVVAPTGFGKTVFATALIATRGVNTVIVVHRKELLKQWKKRINDFLDIPAESIGELHSLKQHLTGCIDIALEGSLSRKSDEDLRAFFAQYGQVIIDESHHVCGDKFAEILAQCPCKYLLGLTATFERTDKLHRSALLLCGPIIHTVKSPGELPVYLSVRRFVHPAGASAGLEHAELLNQLAANNERNREIENICRMLIKRQRRILLLTGRQQHLTLLAPMLASLTDNLFVLNSELTDKERSALIENLDNLPSDTPRIVLATGQLIGEGFDHAPLDTLILALPIVSKPLLTQYIGRVVRQFEGKKDAEIIDIVDAGIAMFERQWMQRQKVYKSRRIHFGRKEESDTLWP